MHHVSRTILAQALFANNKGSAGASEPGKEVSTIAERAVAGIKPNAPAFLDEFADFGFEIEKQLTRTVLAQEDEKPYAVKITGEIVEAPSESSGKRERKARVLKDKDGNPLPPDQQPKPEEKQAPPMICDIINLTTGELQTLVCNASLQDTLEQQFPDLGYIGKCIAFKSKLMPTADRARKFRLYSIVQIKEPAHIGQRLVKDKDLTA